MVVVELFLGHETSAFLLGYTQLLTRQASNVCCKRTIRNKKFAWWNVPIKTKNSSADRQLKIRCQCWLSKRISRCNWLSQQTHLSVTEKVYWTDILSHQDRIPSEEIYCRLHGLHISRTGVFFSPWMLLLAMLVLLQDKKHNLFLCLL